MTRALIFLLLLESFLAKSWLVPDLQVPINHYLVTVVLAALLLLSLSFSSRSGDQPKFVDGKILIWCAVIWGLVSAIVNEPMLANASACLLFAAMVYVFAYRLPPAIVNLGFEPWSLIYRFIAAATVLSAASIFVVPNLAWGQEPDDPTRLRGVMLSTAVACNVFAYCFVLAIFALFKSSGTGVRLGHLIIAIIAITLVALTKTRSSFVICAIALVWIAWLRWRGFFAHSFTVDQKRQNALNASLLVVIAVFAVVLHLYIFPETIGAVFRLETVEALTDARSMNWEFGIERVQAATWWGEGFLSKFVDDVGGISVDVSESRYNQLYDPHSVVLTLAVAAGVPFAAFVLGFIIKNLYSFFAHVKPDNSSIGVIEGSFVLLAFVVMIPAGGSLTSFGSLIDRLFWVFMGGMIYALGLLKTNSLKR